jgi:iron complex outermembrane recepter protein
MRTGQLTTQASPRRRLRRGLRGARGAGLLLACALCVGATTADDDYTGLDIEELSALSAEVTSVSRRTQRLLEVPAAVSVISAEDIRRSGHTSIPELLRLATGVHVARVGTDTWAISPRGFTNEFANKLLVLVDGRVVYTPTFGGTYWNLQDTLLEDIERIEVIRGPGATIWGSNAVNGVINVITKNADETQGNYASVLVGNEDRLITSFRTGQELGEHFKYRVYGKAFARDNAAVPGGHEATDDWRMQRLGFRMSGGKGADRFELDASGFNGNTGNPTVEFPADVFTNGGRIDANKTADLEGGHALFRWRRDQGESKARELQVYYDLQDISGGHYGDVRHSGHGEFQQELAPWEGHALIAGLGWRFTNRRLSRGVAISTTKHNVEGVFYSAFVQDEIELAEDQVWLTLGTKAEWYDRAGWELQPNARVLWMPRPNQQVWLSVARATRSPSEAEQDVETRLAIFPAGTLLPDPVVVGFLPNPDLESEVEVTTEVGYRIQPAPNATFDLALYWNAHENLAALTPQPPLGVAVTLENRRRATTVGGELEVQWRVLQNWRLRATYAGYWIQNRGIDTALDDSPRHQFQVGSSLDLPGNVELDTTLGYVGRVGTLTGVAIDSYLRLDTRIAWQPRPGLELSLVGQNLNDRRHPEWSFLIGTEQEREIERSVYGMVTWRF